MHTQEEASYSSGEEENDLALVQEEADFGFDAMSESQPAECIDEALSQARPLSGPPEDIKDYTRTLSGLSAETRSYCVVSQDRSDIFHATTLAVSHCESEFFCLLVVVGGLGLSVCRAMDTW